jgi:hypothetical protein
MEQQYLIKNVDTCKYFSVDNFSPNTNTKDLNFVAMGNATPSDKKSAEGLIRMFTQQDKSLNLVMEELDDDLAEAMLKNIDIADFIKIETVNKFMPILEGKYRERIYSLYFELDKANIKHEVKLMPKKIFDLMSVGVMAIPEHDKGEAVMILLFDSNKDNDKYLSIYSMLLDMGIETELKKIQ